MTKIEEKYDLAEGEKVTPVMAYTQDLLIWGDVITKEAIRVSTWLRTPAIPQYIFFRDAQVMIMDSGGPPKPISFQELHLPSSRIIGFHLKPPNREPLDYDPDEPNRKMQPVTVLVGSFRFDGVMRMSTLMTLDRFLEIAKEDFSSIYDIEIVQPSWPAMGVIRVPFALLRSKAVLFSPRDV